jgi:gamma-glutamyltranspeptidase/glutathione hydrolase
MRILENGGNAFDAAATIAFTLQAIEPHLNGPAGEVVATFYSRDLDRALVLCGQGTAPKAATPDWFLSRGYSHIPGIGLISATTPGAFDAWMLLLRDHGTIGLETVLSFAIHYARNGFPVRRRMVQTIKEARQRLSEWPTSAALYLPRGEVPVVGDRFVNLALATTFERILGEVRSLKDRDDQIERARRVFSSGFVAQEIMEFVKMIALKNGDDENFALLDYEDLSTWKATYDEPIRFSYCGYEVLKPGPWTQGPVFLQQLAILENFDMAKLITADADFVHHVVEAAKLSFSDRDHHYGDPNFTDIPIKYLLDSRYNAQRAGSISHIANDDIMPGRIPAPLISVAEIDCAPSSRDRHSVGTKRVRSGSQNDTSHFDVVDSAGNFVSATPSGGWLEDSPLIDSLGFPLGNRAQMFSLQEGSPNRLSPGKRPRTTLSPTLILEEGKPIWAMGTPGGDRQDQWSLITLLRVIHSKLNFQEAIELPLFATRHLRSSFSPFPISPGELEVEGRLSEATCTNLERRGHIVKRGSDWGQGAITAVGIEDGMVFAAASPRQGEAYCVAR